MSDNIDSPSYIRARNWIVTVQRFVTFSETASVTVEADSAEEAERIVGGWRARDFAGVDWQSDDNHDAGSVEVVEGYTEAEED